jgi:hypothetical protein
MWCLRVRPKSRLWMRAHARGSSLLLAAWGVTYASGCAGASGGRADAAPAGVNESASPLDTNEAALDVAGGSESDGEGDADAACLPAFDPTTCSPEDLSGSPVIQRTYATGSPPAPNDLPVPPGRYVLTASTAYCPAGAVGYPAAPFAQGIVIFGTCGYKTTVRAGPTMQSVLSAVPLASVASYSGTQRLQICPVQHGAVLLPVMGAWTLSGANLTVLSGEMIPVAFTDGGNATCQAVETFQKM